MGEAVVPAAEEGVGMGFPTWARTVEECEARFGVERERGLSSSEAAARLWAHGPYELAEHPGPTMLQLVAQQFEDTLVHLLLAAAAVSFTLVLSSSAGTLTLFAFVEPLVIFLILVVEVPDAPPLSPPAGEVLSEAVPFLLSVCARGRETVGRYSSLSIP